MSERIHALAYQLFGKSSVDECDLHEIKSMTERYPYFAPARFLLLEKLKSSQAPEFTSQLQKAVLYYHHPLEFEQFISSDRFYTDVNLEKEMSHPLPVSPAQDIQETASVPEPEHEEQSIQQFSEPITENEDLGIADAIIEPQDPIEELKPVEVSEDQDLGIAEEILEEEEENSPALNFMAPENLKEHAAPAVRHQETLSFEPYHTVDYFASQGIRLSQDEAGNDKFGKQLKSFTEWLKTMKKLPKAELSRGVEPVSEARVQHLAEDSVHDADVVTEAMAEVWIKQGKPEKALEVYNKLSLQNPSKNAYFAGKIDLLKRS
jgi:hypothetical protein